MNPPLIRFLLSLVLALFASNLAASAPDPTEFFEKKVRPILIERCFECHSNTAKIKGGLALDSKHDWTTGGDTGPAIIPGQPEESLLIQAITWSDLDLQMPPKKKLSDSEIHILTTWIANGAHDPRESSASSTPRPTMATTVEQGRQFWSYTPIQNPDLPKVADPSWPSHPIDHFILAKLEQNHLTPAPDAAPEVLVRRLAYNLIGLPPTPTQIDQFTKHASTDRPAAILALIDELMASPHFGEKWARHWLDIPRFAESSGGGRTLLFKDAWRYRDYIIHAFNHDRPLDQLIREHIAGDLLPATTPDDRTRNLIATGFLALGPTIYEEQDKQQLRFDIIDEQLDTLGKAFLGQTISCARCHDHKFDPITHADYYALAGIFASTRTLADYKANVATWVTTPLPLAPDQEKHHHDLETRYTTLEKTLKQNKNQLAKLKDQTTGLAFKTNQPIPLKEVPGIVLDDSQAQANGDWKHSRYSSHYFGEGYLHDQNTGKGSKTLTFTPKLPASGRYEIRLAYTPQHDRAKNVPIHIFHALGDQTIHVDQTQTPDIENRFVSLGTFTFEKDGDAYLIISNEGTEGFVTVDLLQFLPEGSSDQLAAKPTDKQKGKSQVNIALRDLQKQIKEQESALKELKATRSLRPVAMTVREEDTIAPTQIRIRGDVHQPGPTVPRGFLSVVTPQNPPIPDHQSGRLELAEWLTNPQNPLTARVLVNRIWHALFGAGLVRTTDNFGTTGDAPSHPELLDYLAQQLVQNQWSTKTLIRQILTTRTWQLAHGTQPSDPDNRLLSHAHRRRLDAEPIRDTILIAANTLDPKIGGTNIEGASETDAASESASNIEYHYQFNDTRRSIYTPAFRNNRLEIFEIFDFGDINTAQGQRQTSTVAPQALYFLNNPFVLQQSQQAAQHALTNPSTPTDEKRLDHAFLTTLSRLPTATERDHCQHFLDSSTLPDEQTWAALYQSLFGSLDFRYLD
ncbi:DUF1553 domain-containing protein [Phragmitibacter flavus]|uniref:DUF1553 domain-containing protein n=1 Tax=Phragmitibacter flavus TaxID=2576071 RepID=A0A5R8KF66_9BACT|nr:DUF1553 domain-containing protein [Phragmitibacter flavus]TLD70944.1 DUF1553 domain-containing protein [Phragmitibacter flavus]